MRRRDLLAVLGAVAASPAVGQTRREAGQVPRIAYLGTGAAVPSLQRAFRQALREAGWAAIGTTLRTMSGMPAVGTIVYRCSPPAL